MVARAVDAAAGTGSAETVDDGRLADLAENYARQVIETLCVRETEAAGEVVIKHPELLDNPTDELYSDELWGAACEALYARVYDAAVCALTGKSAPAPLDGFSLDERAAAGQMTIFKCREQLAQGLNSCADEVAAIPLDDIDTDGADLAGRHAGEIVGGLGDEDICWVFASAEDLWRCSGDGDTLGEQMRSVLIDSLEEWGAAEVVHRGREIIASADASGAPSAG